MHANSFIDIFRLLLIGLCGYNLIRIAYFLVRHMLTKKDQIIETYTERLIVVLTILFTNVAFVVRLWTEMGLGFKSNYPFIVASQVLLLVYFIRYGHNVETALKDLKTRKDKSPAAQLQELQIQILKDQTDDIINRESE